MRGEGIVDCGVICLICFSMRWRRMEVEYEHGVKEEEEEDGRSEKEIIHYIVAINSALNA